MWQLAMPRVVIDDFRYPAALGCLLLLIVMLVKAVRAARTPLSANVPELWSTPPASQPGLGAVRNP